MILVNNTIFVFVAGLVGFLMQHFLMSVVAAEWIWLVWAGIGTFCMLTALVVTSGEVFFDEDTYLVKSLAVFILLVVAVSSLPAIESTYIIMASAIAASLLLILFFSLNESVYDFRINSILYFFVIGVLCVRRVYFA